MEIADQIVARFNEAKARKIESEEMALRYGDWSNPEAGQRCLAVVKTLHADVAGPNCVVAYVMGGDTSDVDGRIWGFAAHECLDVAASDFDLSDAEIFERSQVRYALVWS